MNTLHISIGRRIAIRARGSLAVALGVLLAVLLSGIAGLVAIEASRLRWEAGQHSPPEYGTRLRG